METSVWIARLLGPVVFAAAIPLVATPAAMTGLARDFLESRTLIYLTGVLAMLGGLTVVNVHNIWVADWRVIITLFGWAATIGGVVRMVSPATVVAIGRPMLDNALVARIGGVVWLLAGAFLTWQGYA